MGRDDSEDSMVPTLMARPELQEDTHLVIGRDPISDEDDDSHIPAFTHTLMPIDRPLGTVTVTPRDGLKMDSISADPTDTLIDSKPSAPRVVGEKKQIMTAAALVVIGAIAVAGAMVLGRASDLPPLAPVPREQASGGALADSDLAFLARRWPAGARSISAIGSPAPAEPAEEPPERRPEKPDRRPRATSAPVAPSPAPQLPEPTTEGPDATANIVAKRGAEAPAAEILIDGQSVGQAPLRKSIRPGRHTFEARSATGRTQQTIILAPGEVRRIVLEL